MNRERAQTIAGDLENALRDEMELDPPTMTAGFTFEVGLVIGELRAQPDVLTHQDLTGWADPDRVTAYEEALQALRAHVAAGAEELHELRRQLVEASSEIESYAQVVDPWTESAAAIPTPSEWNALQARVSDLVAQLQHQGTAEGAKEVSAPGRSSAPAAESPGSTSSAPLEPGTPNQEEAPAGVQELRPAPPPASADDGRVACPKCSRQVGLSRWGKVSWHNTPDGRSCRGTGTQITDRTPDMTVGPQVPRQPGEELSERIRRLDTPASAGGCKHGAVTDGIAEPCTYEPDHDGSHSWESRRPKLESASTPRQSAATA